MFSEQAILNNAGHGPGDCVSKADHYAAIADVAAKLARVGGLGLEAVEAGRKISDIAVEALLERNEALTLLRRVAAYDYLDAVLNLSLISDIDEFLSKHREEP